MLIEGGRSTPPSDSPSQTEVVHHSGAASAPAATVDSQSRCAAAGRSRDLAPVFFAPPGDSRIFKRRREILQQSARNQRAVAQRVWVPRCCVYVLRSCAGPERYYTGVSSDWRARLAATMPVAAFTRRVGDHGGSMSSCSSPTRSERSRSSATSNPARAAFLPDGICADASLRARCQCVSTARDARSAFASSPNSCVPRRLPCPKIGTDRCGDGQIPRARAILPVDDRGLLERLERDAHEADSARDRPQHDTLRIEKVQPRPGAGFIAVIA